MHMHMYMYTNTYNIFIYINICMKTEEWNSPNTDWKRREEERENETRMEHVQSTL
jgi:hypothetical protein